MPAFEDLFGQVIPAELNVPTIAEFVNEAVSSAAKAAVVLRLDEEKGWLVADFEFLPNEAAHVLLNSGQKVFLRFDSAVGMSRLEAVWTQHRRKFGRLGIKISGQAVLVGNILQDADVQMSAVRLCVRGFPLFLGEGTQITERTTYSHSPDVGSSHSIGSVRSEADDWKVTIAQRIEESPSDYSHDVWISKQDGNSFGLEEVRECGNGLSHFLAFVAGAYVHSVIRVGYEGGQPVWGEIGSLKKSNSVEGNWFDRMQGDSISTLLPLFWKKRAEVAESFDRMIEAYAESAMIAGIGLHQRALVVGQSGLEHMGYLVLGKDANDRQPSRNIKPAFEKLGISTDLAAFPNLVPQGGDGVDFIADRRNAIHPRSGTDKDVELAWRLCQYYLEVAVLKMCGYNGSYRNRITSRWAVGSEPVPWAIADSE